MPITPGSPWGVSSPVPEHARKMDSDRQLGKFLRDSSAQQIQAQALVMNAGDIPRALGVRNCSHSSNCVRVIIDAIAVSYTDTSGVEHSDVCIGSLSIARRFLRGAISVVTNSGYWRGHEVAPRAHLNDGKLDIFEVSGSMRWSQRRLMWQKMNSGTHLPHPLLSYSQGDYFQWEGSPRRLTIDGKFVAIAKKVTCRVQSDCAQVYS